MIELERLKNAVEQRKAQLDNQPVACVPWALCLIGAMKELEETFDWRAANNLYRLAEQSVLCEEYGVSQETKALEDVEEFVNALIEVLTKEAIPV